MRHFGGIDVLVNNAGVGVFRAVADMAVDDWQKIIDTNLTGVFYCCRAALPHLRARGGGWIINISSLSGKHPFADGAAYCASKAGLNAFSEALMQEVRHDGIRVACVMPGSVRTEFKADPLANDEWKLSPDDVAKVVVDLLAYPSRSLPSAVEIRPRTASQEVVMADSPASNTVSPPIGAIAHYNLLELLEPAGPGDLYRARDTRLGRTVTVRVLPARLCPRSG